MIQQQGVMMKQSSQDKGQVGEYLKGYWWLDSHQICLSFMLRPQCLRFKHAKHNQSKSLSLSFGREEIRLYSLIKAKG